MKKQKILFIIGTKAQLIKSAPIMRELQNRGLEYDFIWTGQHKETIEDILKTFNVKLPDQILYEGDELKSPLKGIFWIVKLLIKGIFSKSRKENGGVVLIHGDAVSALIGLVYGKAGGYKIGHVEAGLRSFNFFRPFPEEIVRFIVSFFTDFHFAPGDWAANNLRKRKGKIINTKENTLLDALFFVKGNQAKTNQRYGVVNLHRFENIQNKKVFAQLIDIFIKISREINLVFILHPTTKYQLEKFCLLDKLQKVKYINIKPRLNYIDFVELFSNSEFLITDGGSNQEETSYLGHPCLLLRNETERREGLGEGGNVVISSFDEAKILDFVKNYKEYKKEPKKISHSPSRMIVDYLIKEGFGVCREGLNEDNRIAG